MCFHSTFLRIFFAIVAFASVQANASEPLDNLTPDRDVQKLTFEPLNLFGDSVVGRIQAITQDHLGFMWIGTRQGLFRYDGMRVRAFKHRDDDASTISSDNVWSLFVDSKDRIWVGTTDGVSLYSRFTERFVSFLSGPDWEGPNRSNNVNGIVEASDGSIYVAVEEGNLYRFDEGEQEFKLVAPEPFGLIKALAIDGRDRIWIGANNKVCAFDPSTGETQTFVGDLAGPDEININFVNSICIVKEDEVWIGTSFSGLAILDPKTGETTLLPFRTQREEYINQVSLDPLGRAWVATNDSIMIYDTETRDAIRHYPKGDHSVGFPLSGVTTIWSDHQGNLWVGSNYDGLSISTATKAFSTFPLSEHAEDLTPSSPVGSHLEDSKGRFWVGHPYSGLYLYSDRNDKPVYFAHEPDNPHSLSLQPILTLFEDSRGQVWVGTYRGGLFRYREETQDFRAYLYDPNDPYSIGGQDIRSITEDSNGQLWIGTHSTGISRFDTNTERFYNYSVATNERSSEVQVLDDWVHTVLADSSDRLWIGTSNGLTVVDPQRNASKHYLADASVPNALSDPLVNQVYEDSRQRIWIATSDGLNLYKPNVDGFVSYSREVGFPHPNICSVVEDLSGYLWTGTLDGLARFDPETLDVRVYRQSDGLAGNDFFEGKAARGSDGTLYFGQSRGLTYFHPTDIRDTTESPKVFITGLRVYSSPLPIVPGTNEVGQLSQSIIETSEITLDHRQNALTFEFVALDYAKPHEIKYAYKLEGLEADWIETAGRPTATYTNLSPGQYTFRIKASNNDGYWNENGDALAITIQQPFWGTPWFRVGIIALLLALPAALIQWRLRTIRAQARRLEKAVDERTADLRAANKRLEQANTQILSQGEALEETVRQRTRELEIAKSKAERSDRLKSAFLANMSHEIRTPMNAIIGFLQILENEDLTPEEREQFQNIIRQSSKSLMSLIDDILDLSTIEAGEAEIDPQPCNLDEICQELSAMFRESLSAEKGGNVGFRIEKKIETDRPIVDPPVFLIDPLRLKQVLWNLISNAIKFTDDGEIILGYRIHHSEEDPEQLRIHFTISDTGIGIPYEEQKQIFNRFHKLDRHGKKLYRGTGLGLTITKTLTELMGGSICLESTPEVGTTFHVGFPFDAVSAEPFLARPTELAGALPYANFEGMRILVVEDEKPNFEYIERVLKSTHAKVLWADNGKDALRLFESESPDLLLLDLMIPEIDGYEVARLIRNKDANVPIIAQSAYAMREDHSRSVSAGANEHLSKPFSPETLIACIRRYLPPRFSARE